MSHHSSAFPKMTAEVLNFKKALSRRKAQAKAAARAAAPPGPTLADRLFEKGTYFDMSTCALDEGTGRILFLDAEAEAKAVALFRRYGLDLAKFTRSWPSMRGASLGIAWAAVEVSRTEHMGHRCSDVLHDYAEAFREQDLMSVRRLAAAVGLLDKIAMETDRAQRMVNVNEKPRIRTDARKNRVIAYLLSKQDPGGLKGRTLEHLLTELFALRIETDILVRNAVRGIRPARRKNPCPITLHSELQRSAGGAKLAQMGLLMLMDCPRPDEAAVLFHMERFAKVMDRSRLKHEWRAILGPFVGFDSNYGLIMESDLEWWRIENEIHGSEWAGLPLAAPVTDKPTPTNRAGAKSAETESLGTPRPKVRPRKSLQATLTVKRLLSKAAVKKLRGPEERNSFRAQLPEDVVEGVLKIGEHEFRMADADTLGLVAFICGVTTVKAVTPSHELVIVMPAKTKNIHEIAAAEPDEKDFLRAFHYSHHAAAMASKESAWTIAWWTEKLLTPALEFVPEHLQVNKAYAIGTSV